jgi:hypothetical protein
VIAGADAKNAQPIEYRANCQSLVCHTRPECSEARQVNEHERTADGYMMSSCSAIGKGF